MSRADKSRKMWVLASLAFVILISVAGLVSLRPPLTPIYWLIREAAILGYLAIFLSIVSSAYMRQLIRFFGRSFVQVHHMLSTTGLALMILHPLAVAWEAASLSVFVISFDSWTNFLTYGGRVVWPLIGLASLAAWLRKAIGRRWRVIHYLNYVAFGLATIHAVLIGTDLRSVVMKAAASTMALFTIVAFVQKRLRTHK